MKIAVTGISGRIGQAIHAMFSRENEVVGVDRLPSTAATHVGEIDDFRLLLRAFEGVQAVIHTAALHAPHVGIVSDDEFVRVNVKGTEQVVRAARECGAQTLVFTSTTALFGRAVDCDPGKAAWITEATVPVPRSIYHQTKLEAEALLAAEAGENFRVTTLRMSRCFPEPAPVMAAYRLHRGIDARDAAEGHRLAIARPGDHYRMFILSGRSPFTLADCPDLKKNARHVLRKKCPEICALFETRGWNLPTSIDRVYDASLAHRVLGWTPQYGFNEVVKLFDQNCPEVLPPSADVRES